MATRKRKKATAVKVDSVEKRIIVGKDTYTLNEKGELTAPDGSVLHDTVRSLFQARDLVEQHLKH